MRYEEDFLSSAGGKKIVVHGWVPEDKVKGLVIVSHGLAEHGKRYEDLAGYLTARGYAVFAADHRGHGLTSGDSLGIDDSPDTFHEIVCDLERLDRKVGKAFPGLKRILLGHSMGSFAALRYAELFPHTIDALVLSGSNGPQSGLTLKVGALIAGYKVRAEGEESPGTLLNDMVFGAYNKRFTPGRTDFDWLSRDDVQVDRYVADPLSGFVPSNRFYLSFFRNLEKIYDRKEMAKIPKDLPVLILSGTEDPVGDMGKGPLRLARRLTREAGIKDLYVRLYREARHEILNEVNREEVYEDLHTFLEMVVSRRKER